MENPSKSSPGKWHYPRVPREHWQDRFQRMKAMGMNTVCTYLFWNVHEPEPGKWDFSGNLDFVEFIKEAQKAGLWVIVRPGPYVCAEWEFGGFPGWLLKDADLKVRFPGPPLPGTGHGLSQESLLHAGTAPDHQGRPYHHGPGGK